MQTLILAAVAASVLASAVSVQPALRQAHNFNGFELFQDIANRASQYA